MNKDILNFLYSKVKIMRLWITFDVVEVILIIAYFTSDPTLHEQKTIPFIMFIVLIIFASIHLFMVYMNHKIDKMK